MACVGVTSRTSPAMPATGLAIGSASARYALVTDVAIDFAALFPADGMIAGSVMLLSADVFGFDQLNNTYVARYRDGTDDVTLFLSRRPDTAAATKLAAALRDFYVKDCGGKVSAPPAAPKGAVLIDSGAGFDGVFTSGVYVAGVHQAPNAAAAERWMQRLLARLASPTP